MYIYNDVEITKENIEEQQAIFDVELLMQEYKIPYKVSYGKTGVVNLEFDKYALIYDIECHQYEVCNVPTMNFIFLDKLEDVDELLMYVIENNIPEEELV